MADDATVDSEAPSELYELTINIIGNGHVNRTPELLLYLEGTDVDLTAVADPGWTFSGWSGDASGTNPTTTVTIHDGDNTVSATFTENAVEQNAQLFVKGMNGWIYYRTYDTVAESWGTWKLVPGGTTIDTPAVTAIGDELYMVVRGADTTSLWFGTVDLTDDSFSGWSFVSGSTDSTPILTAS